MSVDRYDRTRLPWFGRTDPAIICDGVLRALVGRCAQGDTEAFAALYACLLPDVTEALADLDAGAGGRSRIDRRTAEVVTAGAYLELWRQAASHLRTGGPPIRSWIREATCRHVAEYRRRSPWSAQRAADEDAACRRLAELLSRGEAGQRAQPPPARSRAVRGRRLWIWTRSNTRRAR
ncbi:hypothetical protein [Hamadaea tsunoensis]|uniref:hypothetical protein n=1 Tax=Hamadaea tsunoensis TaxID=53368 RepID=UPI0003FED52F|nr:hypothetical protein [Hamadaea tsunoensis]